MMPSPPPPPPPHDSHSLEANARYLSKQNDSTFLVVFLNVVNTITQLFLGAVVFSAFSFANIDINVSSSFTQHVYLCVTGYVILMSQAVLSINPNAGWTHNLMYPSKKNIHWIMQICGSILAIVGSVIRIADMNYSNFETAHGITGLVAMIMTSLSLVGGVMNFICPSRMKTSLYKTLHMCFGAATLVVAYTCLCLGFSDWYRDMFEDTNANLSIACAILALSGILISVFCNLFKREYSG